MYRVAVIGDKDSVLMFKALGVDVYTAVDGEDAKKLVNKLAQEDVGIIFITEDFAAKIQDTIDKYREKNDSSNYTYTIQQRRSWTWNGRYK